MKTLFKNAAQIVTADTGGKNVKRGAEMNNLSVLEGYSIAVEDGVIKDFIKGNAGGFYEVIDVKGKTVLPGLVECHTHTAYAGNRAGEFMQRLNGATYEDIARQGGGIITTVKAVRESSLYDIIQLMFPRVENFISQGVTALEIKSGYGLDLQNEMKLLMAVSHLQSDYPIDIIPTFLGAHTVPPEFKDNREGYIELLINTMLPMAAGKKLAQFCDGFCEKTAFSAEEMDRIFSRAAELGLKIKLHTDQFNSIGGLQTALKYNAVSVDHLEVLSSEEDIKLLSGSETAAVLLPGVSFYLKYGYAPARKLIDAGAITALATDYNPGSSHISNLHFIMSLAALYMNMTIEETISAVTINAARAAGVNETHGSLEIGKKADMAVFDTEDYSGIVYNIGRNLNIMTVKNGKVIYNNQSK